LEIACRFALHQIQQAKETAPLLATNARFVIAQAFAEKSRNGLIQLEAVV
jgi:hypothetical protein